MTESPRGERNTSDPRWPIELLADLHAGALDDEEAARLWERVRADDQAMSVIRALDATTADLGGYGAEHVEMPDELARRIDTALAHEKQRDAPAQQQAPVDELAAARRKRSTIASAAAGVLTAAAAAIAVIAVAIPGETTSGTPLASDRPDQTDAPPLVLEDERPERAFDEALGIWDYGPLEDRAGLDACLRANDIDPDIRPAGVREATVEGESSVLVVLTTGEHAQYRLVAVPTDCAPGQPGLLYDEVIG